MQFKQKDHISADVMSNPVRNHIPGQAVCEGRKRFPMLFDSQGNSLFDDFGCLNSATVDKAANNSNKHTTKKTTKQRIKVIFHVFTESCWFLWDSEVLIRIFALVGLVCLGFITCAVSSLTVK